MAPITPFFVPCHYGGPGDLIWVKETFAPAGISDPVIYRADKPQAKTYEEWAAGGDMWMFNARWKSSIFMRRYDSRLTLSLTDVRVQRLQEISEEDALADGGWEYRNCPFHKAPIKSFQQLWESINGSESWARNDWVWPLTYKAFAKNVDEIIGELRAIKQLLNLEIVER